jgi:cytochrome c-type biogenesis protein
MDPTILALAVVAGAVAAFNPCGFALLPAYLGLLVAPDPDLERARGFGALRRAGRFATGMTVGFVLVFGLFAAILVPLALSVERYLPIVTVLVGVLLVVIGFWLLVGGRMAIPGLTGHGRPPTARWGTQVGYGVSFALASLSCTIAPFLAVTAGSLRAGGPPGLVASFLAYAFGMGLVVLTLAGAVASARASMVARMRRAGAAISRGSALLLVVAGAYVAWYGWFEIRLLSGAATSDPVVSVAVGWQGAISRWVGGLGAVPLLAIAVLMLLVVAATAARRARAGRDVERVG